MYITELNCSCFVCCTLLQIFSMFSSTGYGRSTPSVRVDPSRYMGELIKVLRLNRPIIVSPSMSGGYSLPYIFQGNYTRARICEHMLMRTHTLLVLLT